VSVNAAGFYICAALLVVSSAALVGMPSARDTARAGVAVAVSLGLLLIVSGAVVLGLIEAVLLLGGIGATVLAAQRSAFGAKLTTLALRRWTLGGGVAALGLIVLDGAALAGDDRWHRGGGDTSSLLTLIHYRAPITAGLLLILGVAAVIVASLIGRVSADEHEWDRRHRTRLEREERMVRRREDRAAARKQRSTARTGDRR
jgi:hypothetical protein